MVWVLFVSGLHAEILILKNGTRHTGAVVAQTPHSITLATKTGRVVVQKDDIARIAFATTPDQEEGVEVENSMEIIDDWQHQIDRILKRQKKEETRNAEEKEGRLNEEKKFFNDELAEVKRRKKIIAAKKSMMLPGWGQFYKGDSIRGWGIVSLSGLALIGTYYGLNRYSSTSRSYDESNRFYSFVFLKYHSLPISFWNYQQTKKKRDDMNSSITGATALIGVIAGIYFLGIGDAYFFDPDLEEDKATAHVSSPSTGGNFSLAFAAPQPLIALVPERKRGIQNPDVVLSYTCSF